MNPCPKCGGPRRRAQGECPKCIDAQAKSTLMPPAVLEHVWLQKLAAKGPLTRLGLISLGVPVPLITTLCQRGILLREYNPAICTHYYTVNQSARKPRQ